MKYLNLDNPLYFAADKRCDWNAVAIEHPIVRERRYFRSRHDKPDEVQRIGTTDRQHRFRGRRAARLPQQSHRFRQCKLLAGDVRDKTATANVAARFKPAQHAQQFAPWRQPRSFPLQHAPADDAVTAQQRADDMLDGFGVVRRIAAGCGGLGRRTLEERPTLRLWQTLSHDLY